jgi:hypothetical protein
MVYQADGTNKKIPPEGTSLNGNLYFSDGTIVIGDMLYLLNGTRKEIPPEGIFLN